jgi:hypothetical protein
MAPVRLSQALRVSRPFLIDVLAPLALYWGLRAVGAPDLPALLAGGAVAAAHAAFAVAIERRLRPLPIFVVFMFALTGALAYVTNTPKIVLLKPSIVSAGFGLYMIVLAASPRLLGVALTPLIARGDEAREHRWRAAWEQSTSLRREMRLSCGLAGVLLLAEAAARGAIVFDFTIGQSLILSHAPAVVLVVALLVMLRLRVRPAVEAAMKDPPDALA